MAGLQQYVDGGAVLGYGTTSGGKMRVPEYIGSEDYEYLEDRSTEYPRSLAISRIDETNLNKMASELGISYVHATLPEVVKDTVAGILSQPELGEETIEQGYDDIYYYFTGALLVVMLGWLVTIRKEYL